MIREEIYTSLSQALSALSALSLTFFQARIFPFFSLRARCLSGRGVSSCSTGRKTGEDRRAARVKPGGGLCPRRGRDGWVGSPGAS
jgi:hypothetical protein